MQTMITGYFAVRRIPLVHAGGSPDPHPLPLPGFEVEGKVADEGRYQFFQGADERCPFPAACVVGKT